MPYTWHIFCDMGGSSLGIGLSNWTRVPDPFPTSCFLRRELKWLTRSNQHRVNPNRPRPSPLQERLLRRRNRPRRQVHHRLPSHRARNPASLSFIRRLTPRNPAAAFGPSRTPLSGLFDVRVASGESRSQLKRRMNRAAGGMIVVPVSNLLQLGCASRRVAAPPLLLVGLAAQVGIQPHEEPRICRGNQRADYFPRRREDVVKSMQICLGRWLGETSFPAAAASIASRVPDLVQHLSTTHCGRVLTRDGTRTLGLTPRSR